MVVQQIVDPLVEVTGQCKKCTGGQITLHPMSSYTTRPQINPPVIAGFVEFFWLLVESNLVYVVDRISLTLKVLQYFQDDLYYFLDGSL